MPSKGTALPLAPLAKRDGWAEGSRTLVSRIKSALHHRSATTQSKMVLRAGVEPATHRLRVCCSTSGANGPYLYFASGGIRTPDQRIRSPPLYPTELRTHFLAVFNQWVNDGIRTHDNQNHNLALYQLNYVHHVIMRQRRIELLTHSLEGCCSIQLSYWRKNVRDGGIRTPDLLVPSQTP